MSTILKTTKMSKSQASYAKKNIFSNTFAETKQLKSLHRTKSRRKASGVAVGRHHASVALVT